MIFYNIALYFYYYSLHLAAVFGNQKAKLWLQGRTHWQTKLAAKIKQLPPSTHRFWVHTASLGEFEQGLPVIKALKNKYPEAQIILSFFSPSGYEPQKNCPYADVVCYLPLDTPTNAHQFIKIIQPTAALFVKYEFWYHYFQKLNSSGVPLLVFSAKFTENQWLFKPVFKKYAFKILSLVRHFLVQDTNSITLLKNKLQLQSATHASDTRFETVWQNALVPFENKTISHFIENKTAIVAGSTWQPDHHILLKTLEKLPQYFVLILIPHEINADKIDAIIAQSRLPAAKLSVVMQQTVPPPYLRILIIDTIGMLKYLYKFGKYTYLGGGFGVGIHNTLEAAVYGKPVFFGTKNHKFNEAQVLKKIYKNAEVINEKSLYNAIISLENDAETYEKICQNNQNFIAQNLGGTKKVLEILEKYINNAP